MVGVRASNRPSGLNRGRANTLEGLGSTLSLCVYVLLAGSVGVCVCLCVFVRASACMCVVVRACVRVCAYLCVSACLCSSLLPRRLPWLYFIEAVEFSFLVFFLHFSFSPLLVPSPPPLLPPLILPFSDSRRSAFRGPSLFERWLNLSALLACAAATPPRDAVPTEKKSARGQGW